MNRAKAHKALDALLDALAESANDVPDDEPSKPRRKMTEDDIAKARAAMRKAGMV